MTQPSASRILRMNNPFDVAGSWLKGSLHVHTSASDGALTPDETLRRYRSLGCDFLAITDHESVTIPTSVPEGIIWLPGVEYATTSFDPPQQWHIISVGTEKRLAVTGYPVKTILKLLHEVSPFTILAHPYWSNQSGDDLLRVPPFDALEVYNHSSEMELERGHSEILWDHVLSAGCRVWGLAADDAHHAEHIGGSWIMVRAGERSRAAIIESLRAGRFYSSTGPEFLDMSVDSARLSVRTSPVQAISFMVDSFCRSTIDAARGSSVSEASYEYRSDESYLRIQITDVSGNMAWTNPLCFWGVVPNESEPSHA